MTSPLLDRILALAGSSRPAIVDDDGALTGAALIDRASRVAASLLAGADGLAGARVALLAPQDRDWLAAFFGILLAGGVPVPLSPAYPAAELAWFADDAGCTHALIGPPLAALAADLTRGRRTLTPADAASGPPIALDRVRPGTSPDDGALVLYTSGTTGRPKGALLSHRAIGLQVGLIADAWGFGPSDVLLHALPLHHLHGLVAALLVPVLAGGAARVLPRFDAPRVATGLGDATAFMAVPTMYHRLRDLTGDDAAALARGARGLRLATSGSAALPVTLAGWWQGLHGAIPLERFGMTEIGIALSNPLERTARRPGLVGQPLPTVEIQIVDDELWVRGPSLFTGYLGRPEATAAAFAPGGWFKTGDVAERSADGHIRLLGRTSTDILKSGGYKISALQIEEVLRDHPSIAEVAVVGLPDDALGDRIVAAIVVRAGDTLDVDALRTWTKARLAAYQVPRTFVVVDALPKNPVGKVVKRQVVSDLSRS